MPAPRHSVFTGWMLFLPPNQQRQNTEGSRPTYDYVNSPTISLAVSQAASGLWGVVQQAARWDRQTDGQTAVPAQWCAVPCVRAPGT